MPTGAIGTMARRAPREEALASGNGGAAEEPCATGSLRTTDDPVAGAELALARHQGALAETPRLPQQGSRTVVQVAHVGAPVGEHHALAQAALGRRAPPVGQQPLLGVCGVVGDDQASLLARWPR